MKIWFLASAQGNPFSFDKNTCKDMSSSEPLGERVVNKPTEVLKLFKLCNFFSSIALCRDLARKGILCTRTIFQNRTQNCPQSLSAVMKKNERRMFESYSVEYLKSCVNGMTTGQSAL